MKNSLAVTQFPVRPRDKGVSKAGQGVMAKAPAGLSAEAKRRWRALVEEYQITDAAGLQILQTHCEAFDRMRDCQRAIKKDGLVSTDRFGQQKAHVLTSVERDARVSMLSSLKQLNLDIEPLRDRPGRPGGA
ncbi:MAG: P27 family phage terminase small subunit [Acidobacteriota bacterium]